MVPHHWTQLAGLGINVLAKAGTAAVSKGRSEMFLHEINSQLFAPRGLKVRIASTDAVIQILGGFSSGELRLPLEDGNRETGQLEQRLRPMKPYIAELTFDVPAPAEQTTVLARMSAWQVERQIAKGEKKSLKDRDKKMRKGEKEVRKLDREFEKVDQKTKRKLERKKSPDVEKIEMKMEKKLGKIQREKEKLVIEAERSERKEMEGDKDVKLAKKALWILIENI